MYVLHFIQFDQIFALQRLSLINSKQLVIAMLLEKIRKRSIEQKRMYRCILWMYIWHVRFSHVSQIFIDFLHLLRGQFWGFDFLILRLKIFRLVPFLGRFVISLEVWFNVTDTLKAKFGFIILLVTVTPDFKS